MEDVVADDVLDRAYEWLCRRRKRFPADSDIWSLRRNWPRESERVRADLIGGRYRFGLLSRVTLRSGEEIDL